MQKLIISRAKVLLIPEVLEEEKKFFGAKKRFEDGHEYTRVFNLTGINALNVKKFPNLYTAAELRKEDLGSKNRMNN